MQWLTVTFWTWLHPFWLNTQTQPQALKALHILECHLVTYYFMWQKSQISVILSELLNSCHHPTHFPIYIFLFCTFHEAIGHFLTSQLFAETEHLSNWIVLSFMMRLVRAPLLLLLPHHKTENDSIAEVFKAPLLLLTSYLLGSAEEEKCLRSCCSRNPWEGLKTGQYENPKQTNNNIPDNGLILVVTDAGTKRREL